MGGFGSGRREWNGKAQTVEHCLTLDANRLTRLGVLKDGTCLSGVISWPAGASGENRVGCQVCTLDGAEPWIRLYYSLTATGANEDYRVTLTTTRPQYGGLRWWFVCPLVVNGVACNRRLGKLYLPPGGRYFGCRRCHRLTYASCQEHDKRVDALRRNLALLEAAVYGPRNLTLLCLAWRALEKDRLASERRDRQRAKPA
jgi:hypothetical protein